MEVLMSLLKSVGKGVVNYGEKSLKELGELGAGTLKYTSEAGEKIIDSATKDGGKINKLAKGLFEKRPEDEIETFSQGIIPWRMKQHKTKLNLTEEDVFDETYKKVNGMYEKTKVKTKHKGRVNVDGHETSAVGSTMWKGSTWLKDNVIKSPGGKIALGITGAGFAIGVAEGGNTTKLGTIEGERLANMVSNETSPLLHDEHAVNNTEIHGINTYGADGNIVFALHNMR